MPYGRTVFMSIETDVNREIPIFTFYVTEYSCVSLHRMVGVIMSAFHFSLSDNPI